MTRAIKFRVWDKERKSMHGVSCINFYDEDVYVDEHASGASKRMKISDVELMQFTGLKDKNGKKIWEGDVVKEWEESYEKVGNITTFKSDGVSYEVEFKESGFWLKDRDNECGWPLLETCEVIGNIYENPDLLSPNK